MSTTIYENEKRKVISFIQHELSMPESETKDYYDHLANITTNVHNYINQTQFSENLRIEFIQTWNQLLPKLIIKKMIGCKKKTLCIIKKK